MDNTIPSLSIIVPAFNEESRIVDALAVIDTVAGQIKGSEIIVVNDGSSDRTEDLVISYVREHPDTKVRLESLAKNRGKGFAVRRGIDSSEAPLIAILDADLEYDASALIPMSAMSECSETPSAVFGSRYLESRNLSSTAWKAKLGMLSGQGIGPWLANSLLHQLYRVFLRVDVTDPLTGIKIYPADGVKDANFETSGFEGDHEIAVHLVRNGFDILEIPVLYDGRTKEEGKKIRGRDGVIAIVTFFKYLRRD